jgi:predicted PurR-regulated permease PerM
MKDLAHRPADASGETFLIFTIRVVCLGLLVYWALTLLRPFLAIMLWSVVFTVALYPLFDYLTALSHGRRALVAAAITLFSLAIMFGPATWLGISLAENMRSLVQHLGDGSLAIPPPPASIKNWPLIGARTYELWQLASTNLKDLIEEVAPQLKPVGGRMLLVAGSVGMNILKFVLAIIISGFLFIPGKSLIIGTKSLLSKVVTTRGEEFVNIAGATIRNISRGVIGVAFLQALLAGVGFLIAGFPGAGLLSFLVLLLGIIQIGPSIVIIPTIIWCWFTKDTASALLFTVYMIPVNLVDNVLRPLVMARGLNTPIPLIFLGLIGGTIAHGLIGLFIGPVVLAIMWQLLVVWMRDETTPV